MARQVKGSARFNLNMRTLLAKYPDIAEKVLYQEGLAVQKESMKRTPVLTGALRASHETEKPKRSGNTLSVRIKVGGPAAEYAPHVHFRDDLTHNVGQSRFLESAINDAAKDIAKRMAKKIEAEVRKVVK